VQRRRVDIVGSLSLAVDIATGSPLEHSLRTATVALRLSRLAGLDTEQQSDVFYVALLRWLGCTADSEVPAAVFGDELRVGEWVKPVMGDGPVAFMSALVRNHSAEKAPFERAADVLRAMAGLQKVLKGMKAHCEIAQRLAERMGFNERVVEGLGQVYEFWNGSGQPNHLKGESIALSVRIVTLAEDLQLHQRLGGREAALEVASRRAGKAYDPALVAVAHLHGEELLEGLEEDVGWARLLELEPQPWRYLDETQFEHCLEAISDFCDLKSMYLAGHSRAVASVAEAAAKACGLGADKIDAVRRAALVHELGLVGISAAILDKDGPLTDVEQEKLRLHPYHTERVLSRSEALAELGRIASMHHERLDGSGYYRGAVAAMLSSEARILAAACAYHTLTEEGPGRASLSPGDAARRLREDVASGGLDAQATEAVLTVVGQPGKRVRSNLPAGLTEREVEVLRLIARGRARKEVASQLVIAEKTVARHIEHIYDKIGASTRPAATLFAIEHGLLST
jgi:HD-GYP domain-containing protein (c-di-GMP phosphodiesterase class II)